MGTLVLRNFKYLTMTYAAPAIPAVSSSLPIGNRVLFCDFDGPIADVSERYYATYRICLERMRTETGSEQINCLSLPQFWTFKQNRILDRQIALWSGLAGPEIDRFLAYVTESVNHADLLAYDRLQPQAGDALVQLKQMGVRIVLVTLRSHCQVHQFLHDHGLEDVVAQVYGYSHIHAAYANRTEHKIELLKAAIEQQKQWGYETENSYMIGDTEADVLAGQSVNLPTIALTCGIRSRSYLRSFQPTHIKSDLWMAVQRLVKPALQARWSD